MHWRKNFTIYNRTRATIIIHLTNLFNLETVTKDGEEKIRFEWWGIPLPKFTNYLHPWGIAGVVFTKNTATATRK